MPQRGHFLAVFCRQETRRGERGVGCAGRAAAANPGRWEVGGSAGSTLHAALAHCLYKWRGGEVAPRQGPPRASICATLSSSCSCRRRSSSAARPPPSIFRRSIASFVSALTQVVPAHTPRSTPFVSRVGFPELGTFLRGNTESGAATAERACKRRTPGRGWQAARGCTWVPALVAKRAEDEEAPAGGERAGTAHGRGMRKLEIHGRAVPARPHPSPPTPPALHATTQPRRPHGCPNRPPVPHFGHCAQLSASSMLMVEQRGQ